MLLRFLRWWWDELLGILPRSLASRDGAGQWITLDLCGEGARVLLDGARTRVLADLSSAQRETLERELAAAAADLDPRRVRCRVLLPVASVLRREIELPLAAEENLREVLGFEMSRRTPFRAEDVHFSYRVLSRDLIARRLRVQLEVVPRAQLAMFFSALRAWELAPAEVEWPVLAAARESSASFHFQGATFERRPHARAHALLGLMIVILAGFAIALPLERQREQREALSVQVQQARTQAEAVVALRDQLDARRAARALITGARAGRPAMVELIEELSRALPDDTSLFRLEVMRGEVNLHGSSQTASALIALLEATPYLRGVRFASPVTRDGATSRERFHIVADLVGVDATRSG